MPRKKGEEKSPELIAFEIKVREWVGRNMRRARLMRGAETKDVVNQMGVQYQTYNSTERGVGLPGPERIFRVAKILKCDPWGLFLEVYGGARFLDKAGDDEMVMLEKSAIPRWAAERYKKFRITQPELFRKLLELIEQFPQESPEDVEGIQSLLSAARALLRPPPDIDSVGD